MTIDDLLRYLLKAFMMVFFPMLIFLAVFFSYFFERGLRRALRDTGRENIVRLVGYKGFLGIFDVMGKPKEKKPIKS